MNSYDRAMEMFERSMDEVYGKVESSKDILEKISMKLYDVELSEKDWQELDLLLNEAMIKLDEL